MIREKYIHGNRDDINQYNMYCENTAFFRNELESLDYYSRKYDDAIFFNESAEEIELIEESVTDVIRTIGNKIIEIIKKVRDFIKNIFQKIKTASWEGKSDERKLELLAKKNPDLAKRANVALKEGKINLNEFKDLGTFYRTIDDVLDEIEKSDIDPNSLKGKITKAKEKFEAAAKPLATVAGVAGSIMTIYKFAQLFKKTHKDNDSSLEKMRDSAEVEALKLERMNNILIRNRDAEDVKNLKSKAAVLAYATSQYEQVTNSAISARTKAKFSLIKAYDNAVGLLKRGNNSGNDAAYYSALNSVRSKQLRANENRDLYRSEINNRRNP